MRFVQKIALVFGFAFVGAAIFGFAIGGMSMDAHMETAPRLVGLFPVNAIHNALHLAFGAWGLLGARSVNGARRYCFFSGAAYLVLAALGFVFPDTFGFIPIGGNDIALHGVFGVMLTTVGAMASAEVESPASAAAGR
ncbi:MAG TPA: DUF4383 domain-containing protein [Gemmatimonadaceae bacterium]|nr:DUF4383 domain-containing protein [Gemmatimonadaceae bacterium]